MTSRTAHSRFAAIVLAEVVIAMLVLTVVLSNMHRIVQCISRMAS